MTSCPLKDTSPLGLHLCIGNAVVALCPVDAREKYQNISLLLSNTGCDLNAESHVKSRYLTPDLILSFTKVCGNQDLAVCDFKYIYLFLACDPCWYKLKLLSVPVWFLSCICLRLMHQIHTKSTNVPHVKLRLLRQMPRKMNGWVLLISITYLFNFVQRTSVCNVRQDELTLLTCTITQYLLSCSLQPFRRVSFLHYVTASYLGWDMKGWWLWKTGWVWWVSMCCQDTSVPRVAACIESRGGPPPLATEHCRHTQRLQPALRPFDLPYLTLYPFLPILEHLEADRPSILGLSM